MTPGTPSTTVPFTNAAASLDINFQRANIAYRSLLACGPTYSITLVNGLSYGHLTQNFLSSFTAYGVGTTNVSTYSTFDGGGICAGLELEKRACNTGFMAYGRGMATLLGGEFENSYLQNGQFGIEANPSWKAGRAVAILDLETGIGWTNAKDTIRVTAGYVFSGWFNVVKANEFINAVQSDNFTGLDNCLSFDGFVGHVELRF
jgi:hypothetical protein